ncbi:hypothetical protein [Candidatus Formimonas warabiya]|uniref:Uncharacterized protein n=1 Tax=Formimonas warabiya TaxID=1761012 RepID=A0A3G1KX30_FORW1|nr:hypothetical protein [Candidatus Formimonas warabiya]ATW26970.1 hypothetical protein DCMF_21360 [Candidatus Formimonas warabiya]
MEKSLVKKPFTCQLLIFLHLFLGIGALFGGSTLIMDPSGGLIKMPLTLLEHSPFTSFLIPAIILFVILGVTPLIISYALITKRPWKGADQINIFHEMHWSWAYSLYIGFALIIWITVQVYFINRVAFIHVFYIAIGLIIQAVTLFPSVQNYYRK